MGVINRINTKTFTWIDINHPSGKDLDFLHKKFKFLQEDIIASLPTVEAQRPRAILRDNYLFSVVLFPVFSKKTRRISPSEADVFITEDHLITIHDQGIKELTENFNQLKNNKNKIKEYSSEKPSYFFYELLSRLYEKIFPMLDHIHAEIKTIEAKILNREQANLIDDILTVKSNILSFRRIMQAHRSMIMKMMETENRYFGRKADTKIYFNDLLAHVKDIWGILETYGESIESLENTNNTLIDRQTNKTIKTLTVLTVLIYPLSIFAGLFGMNAKNIPIVGSEYDFWLMLLVMFVFTVGMYLTLKLKKLI